MHLTAPRSRERVQKMPRDAEERELEEACVGSASDASTAGAPAPPETADGADAPDAADAPLAADPGTEEPTGAMPLLMLEGRIEDGDWVGI